MDMWGKFSAGLQTVQNRLDSYIEEGASALQGGEEAAEISATAQV